MDTPASLAPDTLAEQALNNLVNQFARPMDFLRELVQNSIDAGSPRVEVSVAWAAAAEDPSRGVLEVHVDDFGEGMDAEIIDTQLTRMFSSTKEDDLTKIGKFGIGFTSIFAIEPDAVQLRTGRHGSSWEIHFHADRSFNRYPYDKPVDGTKITLFKRMEQDRVEGFVREARWILTYWCEHSNTPITFWDRTAGDPTEQEEAANPFAAFEAPAAAALASGPEIVTSPMTLDADLSVRHERDGVVVVVGYGDDPVFGFYNGGLTLLKTRNKESLGAREQLLGHLCFKVKCNALEHTLTRDNVLQDDNYERAMAVLQESTLQLQDKLLATIERAAAGGEDLGPWHRHLAAECRATKMHERVKDFAERVVLYDRHHRPVTLARVAEIERKVDAVLVDPGGGALADAIEAAGWQLLDNTPSNRDLLHACWSRPWHRWSQERRAVVTADRVFVKPDLFEPGELPPDERKLLRAANQLLQKAVSKRLTLRVGDFGGAVRAEDEALCVEGPSEGGVFQRPGELLMPTFHGWRRRCLLLNRHHPCFRAHVVAAADNLQLASFGLVQAVLHGDPSVGEGALQRLFERAAEGLS